MPWRYSLRCFNCNTEYPENRTDYACGKCGGLLEVRFDLSSKRIPWKNRPLAVWKYREILPIDDDRFITSLYEGGTGLHHCQRLGLELGKRRMVCASTGNTAASLAAYSAKSGLQCLVFVPAGKVAAGKMLQVTIHGARIFQVKGDFDQAMKAVTELTSHRKEFYPMNSLNPFRLEGQKTLAYEICDQIKGNAPDILVLPVGNGGNISAIWKGFNEFHELGIVSNKTRMMGIQEEKAAPITSAVKKKLDRITPITDPQTVATAIRIGSPVNWTKVLRAIKESKGTADTVS